MTADGHALPNSASWQPGHIVAQRYRILAPLGQGGMGAVWRAEHLSLRSVVALKVIHASVASAEVLARFHREAQAAAALRSPHVVQVLDYGVDGTVPYLAMELLEGESLRDRLDRTPILPHADTVRIVTHIARAIGKAHEAGVVHRDLKPDNVFLVKNDDEEIAKVLDFGIAKMHPSAFGGIGGTGTQTGMLLGTPYYMSPEQARGAKEVDHRSDLFSLAVIAFECVCGRRPFVGDSLYDIFMRICTEPLPVPSSIASVPPGFDAWFARAASRAIEARFQSAKEQAEALRGVLLPEGAPRLSMPSVPSAQVTERWSAPAFSAGTLNPTVSSAAPRPRKVKWIAAVLLSLLAVTALVVRSLRVPADSSANATAESSAPVAMPIIPPPTEPAVTVVPVPAAPSASAAPSSLPVRHEPLRGVSPARSARPAAATEKPPDLGF